MLASTTAGTLVADKSHTFTAQSTESIETVLTKLRVHGLLSLPVMGENNQLLGIVSIMDLLVFLAWGPYFEEGELDTHKVTSLTNVHRPITDVMGLSAEGRKLWVVEPTLRLSKLVEPFSSGIHRVLVPQMDDGRKTAYRVLSQSDVVAYIYKHKKEVEHIVRLTLNEIGFKVKPVVSITSDTPALEGFKSMSLDKVPAVAVVENNKLIANLSASDLRSINPDHLKKVVAPVKEFLLTLHGSIRPPLTISLESTLDQAMELLVNEEVHRLWIVNDNETPVGCFSLTDVIRVFV